MNNRFDFKNKSIIIGGATKGIGWATAQFFANRGGNVTLIARDIDLLNKRKTELYNKGTQNSSCNFSRFLRSRSPIYSLWKFY